MLLDEYEEYTSQYQKGIKKISFRSTRPKILKNVNPPITIEKTFGNYDLVFNRYGILMHSIHDEELNKYKVIYGYNNMGVLISAMKLLSEKNILLAISDFNYDENNRIFSETKRSFFRDGSEETNKRLHKYIGNKEEIFMTSDFEEEDEYTYYNTFDNNKRLIEQRVVRNNEELVWWNKNEYDSFGNLKQQISLDDNGNPDGIYEYFPFTNGLETGYKYKSEEKNYIREYTYKFNDKKDWISQVTLNDGEPMYFHERIIEYF